MDIVTVEDFTAMVIRSIKGDIGPTRDGWSSGYMDHALHKGIIEDYDITNMGKPIERRSAARIVHEALLRELGERDEHEWSAAECLEDLYLCHTCVIHIAQVYVKGIMPGRADNLFDSLGSVSRTEAAEIVERMLNKDQRVHRTGARQYQCEKLSPDEARKLMRDNSAAMLIDVRSSEEYTAGHIDDSICIPLHDILNNPFSVCSRKDTPIILYCQKGYKSSMAARSLIDAGYRKIYTIPGIEQYQYILTR